MERLLKLKEDGKKWDKPTKYHAHERRELRAFFRKHQIELLRTIDKNTKEFDEILTLDFD